MLTKQMIEKAFQEVMNEQSTEVEPLAPPLEVQEDMLNEYFGSKLKVGDRVVKHSWADYRFPKKGYLAVVKEVWSKSIEDCEHCAVNGVIAVILSKGNNHHVKAFAVDLNRYKLAE